MAEERYIDGLKVIIVEDADLPDNVREMMDGVQATRGEGALPSPTGSMAEDIEASTGQDIREKEIMIPRSVLIDLQEHGMSLEDLVRQVIKPRKSN